MKKSTKIALAASGIAIVGMAGFASMSHAEFRGGWRGHGPEHCRHFGHRAGKRGVHGPRFMERFFDTNKDGKITQEEIDTKRKELVAKFDTDKDGKLSLQEYEPLWVEMRRQRVVRSFQRFDVDGDAAVTEDEFLNPFSNFVARRDRDGDGALTNKDHPRRGWHRGGPRGPRGWRGDDMPPRDDRDRDDD